MPIRRRLLTALFALFTVLISPAAHATDYVVTTTEEFAAGSLYQTISQANAAVGTHTITFHPSVTGTISMNNALPTITCNLTITGPGASVLKLQTQSTRFFTISSGATVSISGLTLDGGYATGTPGANGTFQNVQPTNGGTGTGGAILNSGNLTLTACVLRNSKVVGGYGGGGYDAYGQNGANGGDAFGGAIYSDGTALTVSGCTFYNNSAGNDSDGSGGGGSYNFSGINGSSGVGGTGGNSRGGAIYIAAGTTVITSSTFANNNAKAGSGGIGGYNTPTSSPGGNGGHAVGGTIYSVVPVTITSCTIANGLARGGSAPTGGVTGTGQAGGLATSSTITIGNTLVAKNNSRAHASASLVASDVAGTFSSADFNLIGAADAATGFGGAADQTGTAATPIDPMLDPERTFLGPNDNGGPTPTLVLGRNSPAIDKGKDLLGTGLDQRGLARSVNQDDGTYPNAVGGDGSDIGALEVQGAPNFKPFFYYTPTLNGTAGSPVFLGVNAEDSDNDPLTYEITDGTLPDGLTLNENNGVINGTVDEPVNTTITVIANDGIEDSTPVEVLITIKEPLSLVVNTTSDADDEYDNVTSLREAVDFSSYDGQSTPVTFDATVFASRETIAIAIPISMFADVEIIGSTGGVTISAGENVGIFNVYSGTTNLHNLTLAGAHTAVTLYGGTLNIHSSTIRNASNGAIHNSGGDLTLKNCTLASNVRTTFGGGAIYQGSGTTTVLNCTLAGNSATFDNGGAIHVAGGTISLGNSIVAMNSVGTNYSHPDISGNVTSLGYNLIGNSAGVSFTGDTATNLINVDAGLDSNWLSYNDGPTQTIGLVADSAAVDKGKALEGATTDQRGKTRPFENANITNGIAGDGSDIGAFEVQATAAEIAVEIENEDIQDGLSTISFGTQEVSSTSELSFIIFNKGGLPLTLSATPKIVVSGTDAAMFTVIETIESPLAEFETGTFTVSFTPTSVGTKTATISIASNDSDESTFDFTITAQVVETATVTPVLNSPAAGGNVFPQATVTFTLPEAALSGSLKIIFTKRVAMSPGVYMDSTQYQLTPGSAVETAGTHTLTIDTVTEGMDPAFYHSVAVAYQDLSGHAEAFVLHDLVSIRPEDPVTTKAIASGDAAPGAGTNGLPADAKIASFSPPATDDDGDLAFLAKWVTTSGKKGSGIFLNNTCLGIVGGAVPNLDDTTYKSFTDPVVDGGKVATIVKLGGVPASSASAVMSGSSLEFIASAGDFAPDADGFPLAGNVFFKAFKQVAIKGDSVAFLAQLGGGGGAGKITGANDYGIWIKEGSDPLKLAAREGQVIGGAWTIKSFVSFVAGNGSPGQGRGWLHTPNGPAVLALATFTDKTVSVMSFELGEIPVFFGETGSVGFNSSPDITDAKFAKIAFPAINDNDVSTFLGSMAVGAGAVTKADATGIFLSDGAAPYTPISRQGKPAGATGANFSVFKDPVLSANGGVAFQATIKGGTVKGTAASTIWWKPAGGELELIAQGGARPGADLPADAQWKAFSSLAISDRGPIFAATLVANKGGVTAAKASGVWACDFTGAPRVLFRTGDTIDGKTVKSFVVLKAAVGSTGVSRSANNAAEIVWLATFTDKSTAIITTEVP